MNTVVLFVSTNRMGDAPEGGWRNDLYTRSLRKIGFIDNRHPRGGAFPKKDEHWLVEIVRENMGTKGGCFILKPMRKIPNDDLMPLVVGMYELEAIEGAVIITPHDNTKTWVMSPKAKKAILEASDAQSFVINHGGTLWPRRKPAESVVESEAKKLLGLTQEGDADAETE